MTLSTALTRQREGRDERFRMGLVCAGTGTQVPGVANPCVQNLLPGRNVPAQGSVHTVGAHTTETAPEPHRDPAQLSPGHLRGT